MGWGWGYVGKMDPEIPPSHPLSSWRTPAPGTVWDRLSPMSPTLSPTVVGGGCGSEHLVMSTFLPLQYKVLSVLPGSGMGIAVSTPSTQKVSAGQPGCGERQLLVGGRRQLTHVSPQPLVFGAMVHRDEAFETIYGQYAKITAAAAAAAATTSDT